MVKNLLAAKGIKPRSQRASVQLQWQSVQPAKRTAHKSGTLPEGALAKQYLNGISALRLAQSYQITPSQVYRVLDRQGVTLRSREASVRETWAARSLAERRAATERANRANAAKRAAVAGGLQFTRPMQWAPRTCEDELTPIELRWLKALSAHQALIGRVEPLYQLGSTTLDLALPDSQVALLVCGRHMITATGERRLALFADAVADHPGWVALDLRPVDFESERRHLILGLLRRLAACKCPAPSPTLPLDLADPQRAAQALGEGAASPPSQGLGDPPEVR